MRWTSASARLNWRLKKQNRQATRGHLAVHQDSLVIQSVNGRPTKKFHSPTHQGGSHVFGIAVRLFVLVFRITFAPAIQGSDGVADQPQKISIRLAKVYLFYAVLMVRAKCPNNTLRTYSETVWPDTLAASSACCQSSSAMRK